MTVHMWDHKLTYVSAPKCGCTSLKAYFHELCTGERYPRKAVRGDRPSVHKAYPTRSFGRLPHDRIADHTRIAVVRDPVSRIESGYYDKIVRQNCLESGATRIAARLLGVPTRPSLDEFVARLRIYRWISPVIYWHFLPLSRFLGRDTGWFARIFDISQIDELRGFVAEKTGLTASVTHRNRKKGDIERAPVTDAARARIEAMYHEDTSLFGAWFKTAA